MKMQRMIRISLLLCWMVSLWIAAIPVKAEQTEATVENQTVETNPQEEGVIQIEDITGLNAEFEALEEESTLIVEEVEQYRKEAKRKSIQKNIVIVLTIVVFGAGIATGIREKKKNNSALADKEEKRTEEVTGGKN